MHTLPHLSLRLVPIYRRNWLVWRKLALPSLVANVADPLITLIAFGYGLGRLLEEIDENDNVIVAGRVLVDVVPPPDTDSKLYLPLVRR